MNTFRIWFAVSATAWLGGQISVAEERFTLEERRAYVSRHDPVIESVALREPLTVGNGQFAFTVDVTGLQTFGAESYANGMPLETQARWAWTSEPNPHGYTLADADAEYRDAAGGVVKLPTRADTPAGQWLRRNPTDHPLAVISLAWKEGEGTRAIQLEEVRDPRQRLELWSGTVFSEFILRGEPVRVVTRCHPDEDVIAIEVAGPAVERAELVIEVAFPRGHDPGVKNTPALDWTYPQGHDTKQVSPGCLVRRVDGLEYTLAASGQLRPGGDAHRYWMHGYGGQLGGTIGFGRRSGEAELPSVNEVRVAAARHWEHFWTGAAVLDLSGSTDRRAPELERRVVLSQYLLAIQCASDVPPQESGLTCSTWYGKHHTEMIWWHAAHFALWGKPELLARNLQWYLAQLPEARRLAASRNLRGARWAKMVGPDGRESPGGNPLIVWNQPHPIYLALMLARNDPQARPTYRELVADTADGLASMLKWDDARGVWVLGPPLWIAQEIHDPAESQNPAFELAYWAWALRVAAEWVEDLEPTRARSWRAVAEKIAPMPQQGGLYVALESSPDTWVNAASRHDHPSMLMALGFLPENPHANRETMDRTLDAVQAKWDWETKIWGWDYPMMAMTATRIGRPRDAVDLLLKEGPNNAYLRNGHCPQRSDRAGGGAGRPEIAAYLPANGALLAAVALMVAGWDGAEARFPGFPRDGTWRVRAEGWAPLP